MDSETGWKSAPARAVRFADSRLNDIFGDPLLYAAAPDGGGMSADVARISRTMCCVTAASLNRRLRGSRLTTQAGAVTTSTSTSAVSVVS